MNQSTIEIIMAAIKGDTTVSLSQKTRIVAACQDTEKPQKNQQNGQHPQFITPKQAAEFLQTSLRTVWRLAGEGKLRRVKLGSRSTRFSIQDIDNIASKCAK